MTKDYRAMRTKWSLFLTVMTSIFLAGCMQKGAEDNLAQPQTKGKSNKEMLLSGDRTIYGLACEGCTDSVVVLLKDDGSDPVRFDIIDAFQNHRVQGKLKVGDWIGLVPNEEDSTVADFVVNLDELKGTWCYVVMPKLKDYATMSPKLQARIMKDMPDSVKEQFMIPREYGFTLRRQWTAQSVGYVRTASALEDESPVVYPRLLYFTEWHILNGQLVMTSGEYKKKSDSDDFEVINNRQDTCEITYLRGDSLVLSSDGESRSYYRRTNKDEINKQAREMAEKRLRQALKERQ